MESFGVKRFADDYDDAMNYAKKFKCRLQENIGFINKPESFHLLDQPQSPSVTGCSHCGTVGEIVSTYVFVTVNKITIRSPVAVTLQETLRSLKEKVQKLVREKGVYAPQLSVTHCGNALPNSLDSTSLQACGIVANMELFTDRLLENIQEFTSVGMTSLIPTEVSQATVAAMATEKAMLLERIHNLELELDYVRSMGQ